MNPKALVVALCAVIAIPCSSAAQTVDELVARHIEARGGNEKLKAIQTIKVTRTVATPFSHVRVILYRKRPALLRVEQGPLKSTAPLVPRGVNGDTAWDTGPDGKVVMRPRPPVGKRATSMATSTACWSTGRPRGTRSRSKDRKSSRQATPTA